MDTATQPGSHRHSDSLRVVPSGQTLAVSAVYRLSEAGRKASLLSGGNGKGEQHLAVQVPTSRLHLVSVGQSGHARLKLNPRFDRIDGVVVRREGPPTYDAPPTLDDLFREAAKNHELAREYQSARTVSRDAYRERRAEVAREFLRDQSLRAMVHPVPNPRRCFIATSSGRLMFDAVADVGPAADVPREALRRFRSDQRARRELGRRKRAQAMTMHEEKTRAIAVWVAENGSEDQRRRHAAGLLPITEVIDALTDEAFATVDDMPRYPLDGTERLQGHLRALTRRDVVVAPSEIEIVGVAATEASAAEWAVMEQLQKRLPDAEVTLREHRVSWRGEPTLPGLSAYGVLATRKIGPFILRREFAVPER